MRGIGCVALPVAFSLVSSGRIFRALRKPDQKNPFNVTSPPTTTQPNTNIAITSLPPSSTTERLHSLPIELQSDITSSAPLLVPHLLLLAFRQSIDNSPTTCLMTRPPLSLDISPLFRNSSTLSRDVNTLSNGLLHLHAARAISLLDGEAAI